MCVVSSCLNNKTENDGNVKALSLRNGIALIYGILMTVSGAFIHKIKTHIIVSSKSESVTKSVIIVCLNILQKYRVEYFSGDMFRMENSSFAATLQ